MATFANIYNQFEMHLLEACEPSRAQLRKVRLPLKVLPSALSIVCLVFGGNLYGGFIVLSSKSIFVL